MRRWFVLASVAAPLGLVGLAARVAAADPAPAPTRLGADALPGGVHAASAELGAPGTVGIGLWSGLGYRKGLLSSAHTMTRAQGDVAISYTALPLLAIGLAVDGRYDRHTGYSTDPDQGLVGDPHLVIRAAAPAGPVRLGGQLSVWLPGKDAPSVALSATSVDAIGLVTVPTGFGAISFDAGFRLDNSAKSVDQPAKLSLEDRVSLGVSGYHAALVGAAVRVGGPGRAWGQLEGSAQIFVGSGAPGAIVRGGALGGLALSDAIDLMAYVELVKVPAPSAADVMADTIPLVPYEPQLTGGLALVARFGGGPAAPAKLDEDLQVKRNARPTPVEVVETAEVSGIVFDETGKPMVGAKVSVKLKNHTGTAVTDSRGAYAISKLPIGKTVDGKTTLDDTGAEITAELANRKLGSATLTLGKGANPVAPITLDPVLPPGQLRAVITTATTSRPIAGATVAIEPGGQTATSGADGKLAVDLAPGRYKLTVTARGFATQQLDVNIEQNGVSIKNIELRK